ncbi:hypothetical protein DPMN_121161 [Dreissena polymorpha]|uniref:Uncharacterized protein n=1 Tax=Dreissena polymorpha TaxID=45954 RepID=A0A9D4JP93_DREPO|nr:hypothetical protein DPMN_121161 [Dreissena polymorpha]
MWPVIEVHCSHVAVFEFHCSHVVIIRWSLFICGLVKQSDKRSGRFTCFSPKRMVQSLFLEDVSMVGGQHTVQVGFLLGTPAFSDNKRLDQI